MSCRTVVIFASRHGATERLAMAAAVGVVEQRGEIRLRRLPDSVYELQDRDAWLGKEYVPPREADTGWADALIFLAPVWLEPSSPDLESYFASLAAQRESGRWRLRVCAVLAGGPARNFIEQRLSSLGLTVVPAPSLFADTDVSTEAARLLGHAVSACSTAATPAATP